MRGWRRCGRIEICEVPVGGWDGILSGADGGRGAAGFPELGVGGGRGAVSARVRRGRQAGLSAECIRVRAHSGGLASVSATTCVPLQLMTFPMVLLDLMAPLPGIDPKLTLETVTWPPQWTRWVLRVEPERHM